MIKLQLFDQNHGLNPLEKCKFGVFFKLMFSYSRKACFLYKTSKSFFHDSFSRSFTLGYRGLEGVTGCYRKTFFFWCILDKNKSGINVKFLTKTMDLLLWKMANFAFFHKQMF